MSCHTVYDFDCDKKCKKKCVVIVKGHRGPEGRIGPTGPALSSSNLYAGATGPQFALTTLNFTPVNLRSILATVDWSLAGPNFRTTTTGRYNIDYSLTFFLDSVNTGSGYAFMRVSKNAINISGSIRQTLLSNSPTQSGDVETISGSLNVDLIANDLISLDFAVTNLNIAVSGFGFIGPVTLLPDSAQLAVVRIS